MGGFVMDLTVLVENMAVSGELLGEYGFSLHLTDDRNKILMDTGQGKSLVYNAGILGLDLGKVDTLLLSHGHFDHTGGLGEMLLQNSQVQVWGHDRINELHMSIRNNIPLFVGCHLNRDAIKLRTVEGLTKINDGLWGVEIPVETRDPEFWDRPQNLVIPSGDGWEPDPFHDDLSFVVEGNHGLSVILGCAHAGVMNILETVSGHFNTNRFYTVLGGMHTRAFSSRKLEELTRELTARFQVSKWRPCHCSGFRAAAALASVHGDVDWPGAGYRMEL